MQLARAGSNAAALRILEVLLARTPDEPEVLQLIGMVLRSQGKHTEAEQYLRRSLRAAPDRAHVHSNLGNLLAHQQRHAEAIECYRSALAIAPDYADAWYNLGTVALRTGDANTARDALERVVAAQPGIAKAWAALGHAYRALSNPDRSRHAYLQALRADARHRGAHHGLALLARQERELPTALQHIDRCLELSSTDAELHLSRGNILIDMGQHEAALRPIAALSSFDPTMSRLTRRSTTRSGSMAMLHSTWRATKARWSAVPAAVDLHVDLAHRLILLGRAAQAQRHLADQIAKGIESASMHHALGRALASQGEVAEAYGHVQHALALDPQPRFRLDAARLCLIENHTAAALAHIDAVLKSSPDDQVAIAYRGVCWRQVGDAREPALNDYSRYVRTFDLPAPRGYSSIEDFNRDLAQALAHLHRAQQAPADQSLRGGTQTLDDLFATRLPLVDALRGKFEAAIGEYVRDLPAGDDHPLLRRKSVAFRFAGSWSVRLARTGHHVNHVHSQGWISSCYYVRVPQASADTTRQAGWLKLGETDLNLAHRERIGRMIQPREGMLVLFPSYMFHGTTPFDTDEERITVAFDVVPA